MSAGDNKLVGARKNLTCIIGRSGQSHWVDFQEVFAVVPSDTSDHFTEIVAVNGTSVLVDLSPDDVIEQFGKEAH